MKKFCSSEYAVRIACSGDNATAAAAPPAGANANATTAATGGAANATSAAAAAAAAAWAMTAVTTVYRSRLSANKNKDLLIHVTWSLHGPALSVAVYDAGGGSGGPHRMLHGSKGSDTFNSGNGCIVGVFWDYASARYDDGAAAGGMIPEPASGFYVAVLANAQVVLLLGDMSREYVDRRHATIPIAARMAALRRHERFLVGDSGCWFTRARFSESGPEHEIGVALSQPEGEAWVSVDGRRVARLRRIRCNFRGARTLFLYDGASPLDMTWDLHGWLFHGDDGHHHDPSAIFTFQARSASERRLSWMTDDDGGGVAASRQGFCLVIQGFRNNNTSTTTTTTAT